MNEKLLKDMKRLFSSDNIAEQKAAALCCYHSNSSEAKELLTGFPELVKGIENGSITWVSIKE